MNIQISFKMLGAAVFASMLAAAQIASAQTPQSNTKREAANTNAAPQPQSDPVGPTHADGKAGKSSRPWFSQESEPDLHAVPR